MTSFSAHRNGRA